MTEVSFFWDGTTPGDAAQAPYTSSAMAEVLRSLAAAEAIPTNLSGVFRGVDNIFGYTIGAAQVTIASGRALVHGRYYKNTAPVTLAAPSSASNRRFRIVLRRDTTAKTTRLTVISGTDGSGTDPVLTQDATTWDQPLFRFNVTSLGVVSLVADDRQYIPRHGDVSAEGSVAIHDYSQINGRPLSADSTPINVGFGRLTDTGSDTGHYANDNHVHGTDPIPFATKAGATARSASNVPADDPDLQVTVLSGHTYVLRARLVISTPNDNIDLLFIITGGTGVVLGQVTVTGIAAPPVPDNEAIGSQYYSSLNGLIRLKGGVTYILDLEAVIATSTTVIKFQWNPNVPNGASPLTLNIGSHMYAILGS